MMLRNIVLITLLVSSVWPLPLEVYKNDFAENKRVFKDNFAEKELDENFMEMSARTGQKLPGVCWACKWAMGKLKEHISVGTSQGDIKKMLHEVCDSIGFLKFVCKNLVANYMGTLIEELSTTDDAATICYNIGIC